MASFIKSGNNFIPLTEIVSVNSDGLGLKVTVTTRGNTDSSTNLDSIVADLDTKESSEPNTKSAELVALELLQFLAFCIDPDVKPGKEGEIFKQHSLLRFTGFRQGQSSWQRHPLSDFDPRKSRF